MNIIIISKLLKFEECTMVARSLRDRLSRIRLTLVNSTLILILGANSLAATIPFIIEGHAAALPSSPNVCISGCTYTTIQAAIDGLPANSTIVVGPGVFSGPININKPDNLEGAQSGVMAATLSTETLRSGNETIIQSADNNTPAFNVTSNGVTLDGFTINGPNSSGTAAIVMLGNNLTNENVLNNIINDTGRAVSYDSSNTTFSGNAIIENGLTGDGIQNNSGSVNNVNLSNNLFKGGIANNADVTFIGPANQLNISNNVSDSAATFIALFNSVNANVSGNTIINGTASSVYIGGNDTNINISNNNSFTNDTRDIVIANDFNDGVNNAVKVYDNQFSPNGTGILVKNNSYNGNLNAQNNWWGSINGPTDNISNDGSIPSTNSGGNGAVVSGPVVYLPWCSNISCSTSNTSIAPTLLKPSNQSIVNGSSVNFTWTTVPGAVSYEGQAFSDQTAIHKIIDITTSTNSYTAQNIPNNSSIYWKVRAVFGDKSTSPWSSLWKLTINDAKPTSPTGIYAQYQYSATQYSSGSYLSENAMPGGNNLELRWDTPSATDWVTGYHILSSFPDGTTSVGYQGPNTNAWLIPNGFGLHGNGAYVYTVEAVNPNGVTNSATFTLYFDNTKPTVAFTSPTPANNSFVNGNFEVGYTAHDNVALRFVDVSLFDTVPSHKNHWVTTCYDNQAETGTDDSGTCNVKLPANLPDGTYYVQVGAQDKAGNYSVNQTRTITVDHAKPTSPTGIYAQYQYSATQYSSGSYLSENAMPGGNNLELRWDTPSATDWVTGYHILSSFPDGTTSVGYQGPNTNAWLIPNGFGLHGNGAYVYTVEAVNPNGVTNSATFTLYFDNTAPIVTITSPTERVVHKTVTVDGNVNDSYPDHYYFVVKNSIGKVVAGPGVVYEANASPWLWDTTKVADGQYTIDIEARDKAGNKSSASVATMSVTVDNTPPLATINTYNTTSSTPTISGTVSEKLSNIQVNVNGHTYPANLLPASGTTCDWATNISSPLAPGTYSVEVISTDIAGNVSDQTFPKALTINTPVVPLNNVHNTTVLFAPIKSSSNNADTGSPSSKVNTNTQGGTTQTQNSNGHVLGAHTTNKNNNNKTNNTTIALAKHDKFLWLGWWWIIVLLVIVLLSNIFRKITKSTDGQ